MTAFNKVLIFLFVSTVFYNLVEAHGLDNCKESFPTYEKYILENSDTYTYEQLDSFCNVFNTGKSEKFYNNPVDSVCYNYFLRNNYNETEFDYKQLQESGIINDYETIASLKLKHSLGTLLCYEHNEYNNIYKKTCPFYYNLINNSFSNIYDTNYIGDIKSKVCRQRDCRVNTLDFYKNLLSSYKNKEFVRYDFRIVSKNEANVAQLFIEFLNSDECVNYKSDLTGGGNEKCGPGYGFCDVSTINSCCSKDGTCGYTDYHCSKRNKCNSDYGVCSTDVYNCGPKYNYEVCQANECCGEDGVCGTGEEYCGVKCQSEFGQCYSKSSKKEVEKKQSRYIEKSDSLFKCGPGYGRCSIFNCCTEDGQCVSAYSEKSQCQLSNGCQPEYGTCYNKVELENTTTSITPITTTTTKTTTTTTTSTTITPTTTTTTTIPTTTTTTTSIKKSTKTTTTSTKKTTKTTTKITKTTTNIPTSTVKDRCGPNYGACSNSKYCCSKYDWCGTSDKHCGEGCQPKYGICY